MPQEAVNKSDVHKMSRSFVFWDAVNVCFITLSRVKCLKNNSCLKYCRQHLLKMQVQLNSMVTQVKKVTIQRMRSGGKGRTENKWDVSSAGQSASSEVNLILPR